ncbi:hypothetical protein FV223_02570 [Methylobacterium sp. WL116]|nr:hypothetical protein FV223_02570 [Methylobacterium sp. WL116]
MFVGGDVIEDGVDHLAGRDGGLDAIEKPDEFAVSVALHAAAEHVTGSDVEGGKQRRCAVTGIVVSLDGGIAGGERPVGTSPLQHLDLALLVDGQHHIVGGRLHVKAHDILDLLGKGRVVRALERSDPMRLQAMLLPDLLYGAQ